jgi:DNA sulfur modification protein DndE
MRLRTSADTEMKLIELDKKIKLSSKAAIMRIAIACSLKQNSDPRIVDGQDIPYDIRMQGGVDYQRMTIFGQMEYLYRILMTNHIGRDLSDEEFFPELTVAHIRRGIDYLYSEYRYIDNKDKFFANLIKLSR